MSLKPEEKKRRQKERKQKKYNDTHKEVEGVIYKYCTRHHEYFPEESEWFPSNEKYFYLNKSNTIDGLTPYCKECSIKSFMEWEKDHPERYKELYTIKNNKPKAKERMRRYAKEQKSSGYQKEYQQNNKDKLKKYGLERANKNHEIDKEEWENCKKYFNYKCAYCNKTEDIIKAEQKQGLHKEHVIFNGANDLSNCVPSCRCCNSQKWEFNMEEWYRQQNFFNEDRLNKIYAWINEDHKLYIKEKLPYKIVRKRNEDEKTFHYELWSINENRDLIECLAIGNKKKDLNTYIKKYYRRINNNGN